MSDSHIIPCVTLRVIFTLLRIVLRIVRRKHSYLASYEEDTRRLAQLRMAKYAPTQTTDRVTPPTVQAMMMIVGVG